jgi:superfamily II DNA or RNA helicase
MTFSVGSLVRARGRDWVVLPDSDEERLLLRPLGGAEAEVAGLLTALEIVESATFDLPTPQDRGDDRSARLLRDALRLGFRSSAGPFRCFGSLNFEPRPYQLVPLLMALRQDTTRVLIADDVGTGKTASALLVAAELLAQGELSRLSVLCPPHLAAQWRAEMVDKFHLDPVIVLPATAPRLERQCRMGESIFDRYDMTIVSTDFIKADRRRHEFLRAAPELVLVDEAHTCTPNAGPRSGRHQRYELLKGLAEDPERHLILVTATPHAGKGEPWRALLATLSPALAELPEDLSGETNRRNREAIARHVVQRTRGDLRRYLEATQFPEVQYAQPEPTYRLSEAYRDLFDAAYAYATDTVRGAERSQRLRWWSALALLRSIGSSPAAAVATLSNRAANVGGSDDLVDHPSLFDYALDDDEDDVTADSVPGADLADEASASTRRKLTELRRLAEACFGEADTKLAGAVTICRDLIAAGFRPIVFCRYIPTANHVADELARSLRGVEVRVVTGEVPAPNRPDAVQELAAHEKRVLVATDCLAEGINLQGLFDAVLHFDLLYNPSKMAQREGRVSRLNQPSPAVRVVTYYGEDNHIDDLVLQVLQRRHVAIRTDTGVSIPVPGDPNALIEAFAHRLLASAGTLSTAQLSFEGMDAEAQVVAEWEQAAEREKRSRTLFAQEGIKVDEVAAELERVRTSIGAGADVRRFVTDAATALGATVLAKDGALHVDLAETSQALRDTVGVAELEARFEPPAGAGEMLLSRTHPVVAGLAKYVLDTALDTRQSGVARRAGVIRTTDVATRTVLVLARYRFHLSADEQVLERQLLAEDCAVLAFTGDAASPQWLEPADAEDLLTVRPSSNVASEQAEEVLSEIFTRAHSWLEGLTADARRDADVLLADHRRVRQSSQRRVRGLTVEPQLPADVIGCYVLLPDSRPRP